jgi:hypothetical protein
MSNEQRIRDLLKAALNGEAKATASQAFGSNAAFTPEEKEFIIAQLELHTGAKTVKDEESQCYVTVYANGEVAYTKGVDFANREVDDLTFKKFIKRDMEKRATMEKNENTEKP